MPGIVQHQESMHGPCVFQNGRLYCVQMLRVLLRARVGGFQAWGVEYLVLQLYDANAAVRMEALAVLFEACEDEVRYVLAFLVRENTRPCFLTEQIFRKPHLVVLIRLHCTMYIQVFSKTEKRFTSIF